MKPTYFYSNVDEGLRQGAATLDRYLVTGCTRDKMLPSSIHVHIPFAPVAQCICNHHPIVAVGRVAPPHSSLYHTSRAISQNWTGVRQ